MCLGIGGSSAKTDRTTQLTAGGEANDIIKSLKSIGTDFIGKGKTDITRGQQDTEKASKYYSDILSGDPTKVMAAVAPESKAIADQTDQQKQAIARTGNRTGGTNALSQDLNTKATAAVGDIVNKARAGAAGGVERTGAQFTGTGVAETGEGIGATATAGSDALGLYSAAAQSRQISQQIHDAAVQQWADLISSLVVGA